VIENYVKCHVFKKYIIKYMLKDIEEVFRTLFIKKLCDNKVQQGKGHFYRQHPLPPTQTSHKSRLPEVTESSPGWETTKSKGGVSKWDEIGKGNKIPLKHLTTHKTSKHVQFEGC
jgi:hypothetical protein